MWFEPDGLPAIGIGHREAADFLHGQRMGEVSLGCTRQQRLKKEPGREPQPCAAVDLATLDCQQYLVLL